MAVAHGALTARRVVDELRANGVTHVIWLVDTGVNTKAVGCAVGVAGGRDEIRLISSTDPGGWLPTDPSFDHIKTSLLVVPA